MKKTNIQEYKMAIITASKLAWSCSVAAFDLSKYMSESKANKPSMESKQFNNADNACTHYDAHKSTN